MLYKVSPMGYFGRVQKVSRGPWFEEYKVEDDGLEYYYVFGSSEGAKYLLTNNIPYEDRERLARFYKGYNRNRYLSYFGGLWLGLETVTRVPYFTKMAIGWRVLSLFGTAYLYKTAFQFYNSSSYGPILCAYFRKYADFAKTDKFDITDRKREFYEIDTSQYMSYDFKDMGHEYHAHHGPQPVSFLCLILKGRRGS